MYIMNIAHAQNVPFKTEINSNVSETDVTSTLQNVADKKQVPKNNKHVTYLLPTIYYNINMVNIPYSQ